MKDWLAEDIDIRKIEEMSDQEAIEYFGLTSSDKPVQVLRRTYHYTKARFDTSTKQKKEK